MTILVLDNYDSFTWNLVHAVEAAGGQCVVHRSDSITIPEINALQPDGIILSPGPFGPSQTGVCADAVTTFADRIPILGVCLGMQVISEVAGAVVRPSGHPVHGKASTIRHDNQGLLKGLPNPFLGGRYHSLIIDQTNIPPNLEISAWSDDGQIMGVRLRSRMIEGVLFHPESFLTAHGAQIFENFATLVQANMESEANVV